MQDTEQRSPDQCAIGVYDSIGKAESAVHMLHRAGFVCDQISIVRRYVTPQEAEKLSLGDDSLRDAAIGGALGGLVGIAGTAAFVSVTGVGLILLTGPLMALTGAIVGAFLGAMEGWGIHEANIRKYENLVKEGRVLVAVTGDPLQVEEADRMLRETEALDVTLHAKASDESQEVDDRPGT